MLTENAVSQDLDFTQFIAERTGQFTGRGWVFEQVGAWLRDPGSPRVFLLSGAPGTGKTAIAARIVQVHLGQAEPSGAGWPPGFLAYYHFCQTGRTWTLGSLDFVRRLSLALAARYPAFLEVLRQQASPQVTINSSIRAESIEPGAQVVGVQIGTLHLEIGSGDAQLMFDQLVRGPLWALCEGQPDEPVTILIDSLDEALGAERGDTIAQLLRLLPEFPPQVRFLLTSRSEVPRVADLIGPPTLDLIKDAPSPVDDVADFARVRLGALPEPRRSAAAARIALKSDGNFLYAFHVLNDLTRPGVEVGDTEALELPDTLEGVYQAFLERTQDPRSLRWQDQYRPLVGCMAVARGEGLTKAQLVAITGLAQDVTADALNALGQYLVGGAGEAPYRIFHQSFREFFLNKQDQDAFCIVPAERHASMARYFQGRCSASWSTCGDLYALRYTPLHQAEAADLSASPERREGLTQALIGLSQNLNYQRRFERRIGDIPTLKEYLHRAVALAARDDRADMLPWLIRATRGPFAFHREFLLADTVVVLAQNGKLDEAQARLRLFSNVDEDWQTAARLILAWLGAQQNPEAAKQILAQPAAPGSDIETLQRLRSRLAAALAGEPVVAADGEPAEGLDAAQDRVKCISGQAFINPSLINSYGEMIGPRGYVARLDAPRLVDAAREYGVDGTTLVDGYIDAHANYIYVEYRNRSLWFVLQAVLGRHPEQAWVQERLRRILVAALSGGGMEFQETLPLTAFLLRERANGVDAQAALKVRVAEAKKEANTLQGERGANDSWGIHKRRLTGLMELETLLFGDADAARELLTFISKHEFLGGFAGYQAPAKLRLADALRACGMDAPAALAGVIEDALRSAHHVQDYRFCARLTARCNALKRWHATALAGQPLADLVRRFAAAPGEPEFATCHRIGEDFVYRDKYAPGFLSIEEAQRAQTLEELALVFQRPALEFLRLNPEYSLTQPLADQPLIRVPDRGFAPLLAVHLAARVWGDAALEDERAVLFRALVPVAAHDPTALDTLLSYLLLASAPEDPGLLAAIVKEAGPLVWTPAAVGTAPVEPNVDSHAS